LSLTLYRGVSIILLKVFIFLRDIVEGYVYRSEV